MTEKKGIPPWMWVGCGCVGAIAALVLIVAGLGFWGAQKAREIGEAMNDPEARADKALEVLGAEALPEGYFTVTAVSVPFVLDFVVLSDQPPPTDGEPSESAPPRNGFMFMSFPSFGEGDEELYDFFEGRSDNVDSLKREQFNVDLRERVATGRFDRAEDQILWVSHRGAVESDEINEIDEPDKIDSGHDGLLTMMLLECDDDRRRVGIWFGPDPSPESPADSIDLTGTVGDASEIENFMRPLSPCN